MASDLVKAAPEVQVTVDPNKAIGVGLTAAQVGGEVRNALTAQTLGRGQLGDADAQPLVLRLDPAAVGSVAALKALPVGTAVKVPLGTIAAVEQADVQGRITRIDEAPSATITAQITSGDTGTTSSEVQAAIDRLRARRDDPGVRERRARRRHGPASRSVQRALRGDGRRDPAGLPRHGPGVQLAGHAVHHPVQPAAGDIGAFPALLLTNRPIGISALIGFLMLIGIVVTNAIVLLDLVERLKAEGYSTRDALIEGGRTRLRPILMTAIATILALVPLAAGFNEGSIIAAELGTVVIGGLLSSTLLTLLVVPAVYALVDGLKARIGRRSSEVVVHLEPGARAPSEA